MYPQQLARPRKIRILKSMVNMIITQNSTMMIIRVRIYRRHQPATAIITWSSRRHTLYTYNRTQPQQHEPPTTNPMTIITCTHRLPNISRLLRLILMTAILPIKRRSTQYTENNWSRHVNDRSVIHTLITDVIHTVVTVRHIIIISRHRNVAAMNHIISRSTTVTRLVPIHTAVTNILGLVLRPRIRNAQLMIYTESPNLGLINIIPMLTSKRHQIDKNIMNISVLYAVALRRVMTRTHMTWIIRRRIRMNLRRHLRVQTNIIWIANADRIITDIMDARKTAGNVHVIVINTRVKTSRDMVGVVMVLYKRAHPIFNVTIISRRINGDTWTRTLRHKSRAPRLTLHTRKTTMTDIYALKIERPTMIRVTRAAFRAPAALKSPSRVRRLHRLLDLDHRHQPTTITREIPMRSLRRRALVPQKSSAGVIITHHRTWQP